MPIYTVRTNGQRLMSGPSSESDPIRLLTVDDRLEPLADAQDGWRKVKVVGGPVAAEGYVQNIQLVEAAKETPPPVDPIVFFNQIVVNCRQFGANPFYLFAVAFKESGLKNIDDGTDFKGPLQFKQSTWDEVCAANPPLGITPEDIWNPGRQAIIGAVHTADLLAHFTGILGRPPQGRELYLGHLLGKGGGAAVLRADRTATVRDALATLPNVDEARIITANAPLLTVNGQDATVAQALDLIEAWLAPGYAEAWRLYTLLYGSEGAQATEADDGGGVSDGDPPWLVVAYGELGVDEFPGAPSNPQVEKYFQATRHQPTTDDTDWCAAFVSWCMAKSGDPAIAKANLASAWAADWLHWGHRIADPRRGALVFFPPADPTRNSGHVGFLVGWSRPGYFTVLGGNQTRKSDQRKAVCLVDRSVGDLVQLFWGP